MTTTRRNFLGGIIAAAAAPAIVRAEIIMPVRTIWKPASVGFSSFELAMAVQPAELGAIEAAALQQMSRFYDRLYSQAFKRALGGFGVVIAPDSRGDWVAALKGPT